jgi:hypothetical protein
MCYNNREISSIKGGENADRFSKSFLCTGYLLDN